ncbi:MAG: putative DNA binding domain-containing protein [Pseudoflavonifractor sp.]|nr:putative DNA binding domain-containing protein [Pseudoflavonifractor sp.]
MTDFDIKTLSDYREYNQLEAKSAKGGFPGSFWETYSAFANTDGGVILLGVKESSDGSLHSEPGIDIAKLRKDFWNMVNNRQKISANIVTESMVTEELFEFNPILAIRVPRAERSAKPVFVGSDPKSGTYRRNHEGDYHCSLDEMSLMFRDASAVTQDAKVLENMDSSVFCRDTVKGYRNFFRTRHSNHLWNNEEDEIFLRKIGAISIGTDGKFHPTAAGLLMFGYEYEIIREFPNYFLDYQENRSSGRTRWTDRVVSTSGDWSGNVFDFVIDVLSRIQRGLKTPFVLKGNQRIDDTPIHKLLREAITNACVHADFYGRQGLVVQKSMDGYRLSNPGSVRISISEAIDGGISDPRNGVMLKMFSLIDFGERAGSGLNEICTVWEKVYHTPVTMEETHSNGVDRTILTLSTGGNEQDVEAMLELYDADSIDCVEEPGSYKYEIDQKSDRKVTGSDQKTECTDQKIGCSDQKTDQKATSSDQKTDQKNRIINLIRHKPEISRSELAARLSIHESSVKRRLEALMRENRILRVGPDKGGSWKIIE